MLQIITNSPCINNISMTWGCNPFSELIKLWYSYSRLCVAKYIEIGSRYGQENRLVRNCKNRNGSADSLEFLFLCAWVSALVISSEGHRYSISEGMVQGTETYLSNIVGASATPKQLSFNLLRILCFISF